MEEEGNPSTRYADSSPGSSVNLAEGSDFCLLSEDDIEMEDTEERIPVQSSEGVQQTSENQFTHESSTALDVEAMKRKADVLHKMIEIASSLRKFKSNRTSDSNVPLQDYEPPEELKRFRERSAFVAQKLKEDRLLFEESKKRNEAVVDKVRTVKQLHKSISESAKELKRDDPGADEIMTLKLKIERLEASLSHSQSTLASKNQILFENKETIRTLSETVNETRAAYHDYVERSQEEIQELRDEQLKALEKIANSRDEFQNQLQTVRKRYLLMENDLKLSEFARFKLVSRNAELRERICQLETELQIPHTKSMSLEDIDGEKSDISLSNQTIAASDLCPKIECLATITNEFCSYLVDFGNCDFEDDVLLDNSDPLQNLDEVSDRLESVFYVVRDKLSAFSDLEDNAKRTEEKLRQLEASIEENKNQDAKLKKILATMKAKIQSETNINKDLTEQLSKAHVKIQLLEQSSEQDWLFKCDELERTNERLQHELNILQNALTAKEPSPQMLDMVDQLKRELEAKIRECEGLRLACEELEDTNDKLENDFVVLRTRDCDEEEHWRITCAQLEDENRKLIENTRLLSERAMEYENERLSLYQQVDELRQTVNDLTNQLETVNKQLAVLKDSKIEHDSEMEAVIDNLTAEYNILSRKMNDVQKQLEYESTSSQDSRQLVQLAENTNARLSHEIHDLQKRNQELEAVKISLENRIVELETRLETFENEKLDLLKSEQSLKDMIVDYQRASHERGDELEYLKQHNISLVSQVESLKAKMEVLDSECATYMLKSQTDQSNHEALVRANEELTSSVRLLRQTISDLEDEKAAQVESLRAEKELVDGECATYMLKAQADEVNQEALVRANEELTSTVRQLRKTISDLEHEKRQLVCHYEAQFANDSSSLRELESLKSQNQELLDKCAQHCNRVEILENERASLHNDSELQTRITSLEAEKQLLETECEKFKNKYQRLQLLCKANINKAVSEAKAEVEKYKTAWLEATNQQRREGGFPAADADEWKNAYMKVQDELAKAEEYKTELQSLKETLNLELESWKGKYDEVFRTLCAAQQEIDNLKHLVTEYEVELQKKVQEISVQPERPPSRTADSQLLDMESTVDVVVSECLRRTDEDVQRAVDDVVNECLLQTDELRNCINELKNENQRLREQHKEMEICQMRVGQLQEELRSVRLDYNNLEQRLYNMDEESEKEIARYEELLSKASVNLMSVEESLAETRNLLQRKENDYLECRHQLQEFMNSDRLLQEHQKSDTIHAAAQTDSEGGAEQPASIASYFDYYKGKITNVLQPEEQSVDYSNWIFPESQDKEYQMRYQQVPTFGYEASEESTPAASVEKGSQTLVMNQDQASQAEIANLHQLGQNLDPTMQTSHQTREKQSPSEVVDQLRELLVSKMNGDEWLIDEGDWSSADLDVYNENFVNTSFKFVDLCEAIIQFYSTIPQANVMVDKLKKLFNPPAPEREESSAEWNHQDSYYQLITLCTQLECENKYLVDAVTYVEDTILIIRPTIEITRFHDVLECWRTDRNFEETDIIDRVCEEYDIVPSKFAAGSLFATWKETMLKSLENFAPVVSTPSQAVTVSSYSAIEPTLVCVMKKNHKLIGDLYYKYGADKNFDPNEFFEQIDDVNLDVERLVKFVKGEIEELEPPVEVGGIPPVHSHAHDHPEHEHEHDHDHHDHDHHHHDHEHDHHHDHEHDHHHHDHEQEHDHHHNHDHEHDHRYAQKDHHHHQHAHQGSDEKEPKVQDSKAVEELKQLLAESNKKIDSLVRELMEAKNSKDYNEMKQLHAKLDETLYQLHLSDVHNVELTQELTQLLSERDALQLKLSSVIRQYEELRQAFVSASKSSDDSVPLPNVSESYRLEELQKVNYMKDPRISEASSKYHPAGTQLYAEDSAETAHRVKDESTSGFSLFKWITGDTDGK